MTPLVVWGVHRSGTSVLTRGLERLGWQLGAVNRTGTVENPDGYFENLDLRDLNLRLLAALGTDWTDWRFVPGTEALAGPEPEALGGEAAELLDALEAGGPWALKDPRMTGLAPFWTPIFAARPAPPRHLLIVRDPAEVALSQAARAVADPETYRGLSDPEDTSALWLRHMQTAAAALDRNEVLLIRHADLAADATAVYRAVLKYAEHEGGDLSRIADLFQQRYHRARAGVAGGGPLAQAAGRLFRRLAEGGTRVATGTELAAITDDEAQVLAGCAAAPQSGCRDAV